MVGITRSKVICLVLLCTMVVPAWVSALSEAKIPEGVQTKLVALGFETAESFHFKSESVFGAFAKHFMVIEKAVKGLSDEDWDFHLFVCKLWAYWANGKSSLVNAPPALPNLPLVLQRRLGLYHCCLCCH